MRQMIKQMKSGGTCTFFRVCLVISMLLSVASVNASDFTVDGVSYEATSDSTCKVVAGDNAYDGMITIPSEVSYNSVDYKVTAIGEQAFLKCGGLMDVKLPESLEEIGSEAFGYCYALTAISIPDNIKSVDKSAFNGTNIQDLYIGDCVNRIGMGAFSFVPSVHLNSSITKINDVAFEDADDLRYIYIPNTVKEIETNAFAFCGNLQGVYIDDLANWCGIKFGNQYANPTSKAGELWVNGTHLTYLDIPDDVTSINDYAFYGCKYIYELKLSDSVDKIGHYAFQGCDRLSTLRFGRGLRYIGTQAIRGNNIFKIYTNDINSFCQIDIEDYIFNQFESTELFYNEKLVTKIQLDESVKSIGKNVFRYYAKLASISMPNSVTSIGESAFFYCRDLVSVTLSDSVKVIPRQSFNGCYNMSKIHLPAELVEIGDYAFQSLGIKKIVLPPSVVKIGEYAFDWCDADTIILSDNIKELKDWTFSNCHELKYIDLGNSMKRINGTCFYDCKELTSLTLPASMEYINMGWSEYPNFNGVYCNSYEPYQANFPQSLLQQSTLYVPQGCRDKFLADDQWNGFKEIIEMDDLGAVDEIDYELDLPIPMEIYDAQGKRVGNSIEDLKSGMYIVKKGNQTKKIIKQ